MDGTSNGFEGITSEPLLFVLFILVIFFSSNALWGTIQKWIEQRKNKKDGKLDERKLDFEIDKFNIETMQRAIISQNKDIERMRKDLTNTQNELSQVRNAHILTAEKNAAMYRYIAKSVSHRKMEGVALIPVDDADVSVIPEVVNLLR